MKELHFAAGPQARWRGAGDEHTRSGERAQSRRASGPHPKGRGGEGRVPAVLPLLDDAPGIACVAAPCICPPRARAKEHR